MRSNAAIFTAVLIAVAGIVLFVGSRLRPALSHAAGASNAPNRTRAPSQLEIREPSHDFGEVLQSVMELEQSFELINHGRSAVELRVRSVGCSCLDITIPPSIPPGGSATCVARLTLGGREGRYDVPAVIETSEPGNPTLPISIGCDIVPDVRLDPPQLDFRDVKSHAKLTAECTVITAALNSKEPATHPVQLDSSVEGVHCRLLDSTQPVGLHNTLKRQVHRFLIDIDSSRLVRKEDRTFLPTAVAFDCPEGSRTTKRLLPITVQFRRHDHLAGPQTIALRRNLNGSQTVKLLSLDHEPFMLKEIHISAAELVTEKAVQQPALEQSLTLRFSPTTTKPQPDALEIQKFVVTAVADRWPDEPYRFEALLLP